MPRFDKPSVLEPSGEAREAITMSLPIKDLGHTQQYKGQHLFSLQEVGSLKYWKESVVNRVRLL